MQKCNAPNAEMSCSNLLLKMQRILFKNIEIMLKMQNCLAQNACPKCINFICTECRNLMLKYETLCLNAEALQAACGSLCAEVSVEQLCSNTQLTAVPEGCKE